MLPLLFPSQTRSASSVTSEIRSDSPYSCNLSQEKQKRNTRFVVRWDPTLRQQWDLQLFYTNHEEACYRYSYTLGNRLRHVIISLIFQSCENWLKKKKSTSSWQRKRFVSVFQFFTKTLQLKLPQYDNMSGKKFFFFFPHLLVAVALS